MSGEAWLTLAVVLLTVIALARDWATPAIAVLAADVTLLVAGVVDTEEALAGFSNVAPVTVAALYVIARAVEKTGALQPLVSRMLGDGSTGRGGLARLLVPTAGASALLNNTPIVAMLVPQVSDWARRHGASASRYLMPLSFATILGGTLTVVGTSTNIVVSGLLQAHGHPAIGMFEITRIGLPVAVVGIALLLLLTPSLLPERRTARQEFEKAREFVVRMEVQQDGPLDGQTVSAAVLRGLQGVYLAEIERDGQMISPAAPTTVLRGKDRLVFVGRADPVRELHAMRGLRSSEENHIADFHRPGNAFFEVVISGTSHLVGKTLRSADFRSHYQAAVLAMHRAGQRVRMKLDNLLLREGDTLLLISDPEFRERWRDRSDFLLVSRLDGTPPLGNRQAVLVGGITLGMVLCAATELLPILHAALLAALGLLVAGVLTPTEARRAIRLDVIVLIAASFGIGAAIENSGLAAFLAAGTVHTFAGLGPHGLVLAVALATVLLTELITNNAAAVLLFPIVLATAGDLGLDARPFLIAMTVAASASFLTPIGYQTNTMVYGPGGYHFGDYVRLGGPITIAVIVTIVLVVPLAWPP